MFSTVLLLFIATMIYEAFVVAYTVAVADRKVLLAATLSALMEPVKYWSLLTVVETTDKMVGVFAISAACAVSNILILTLMNKLVKRKRHETKIYRVKYRRRGASQ